MIVALAADHAGWPIRARIIAEIATLGHALLDCGSREIQPGDDYPDVAATVCHDSFSARQGVEDDDMNVLCFGARVIGEELAADLLRDFLDARFSGAERHRRRVAKIAALEGGDDSARAGPGDAPSAT